MASRSWAPAFSDRPAPSLKAIGSSLMGTQDRHPPPGTVPGSWSDPVGAIAGVIELVGGVMIAFGLQTGYAAFLSSGLMAVAYFKAHAAKGFWPIQNRGELAVLYCFLFLYMATRGSGRYSLDALLFGRGKTVTGFKKT